MSEDIVFGIFKLLLLIGSVLIIGAFIKIIIDIIKRKKGCVLFKKRNIIGSDIDILASQLLNMKGYKKIFKTTEYLVFINEYQIDLVFFCDYFGMLSGKENDPTWYFNSDSYKQKIENPIVVLDRIKKRLIEKIGNNNIREYILLGSNTLLNVSIIRTNVIRRNNAYYALTKRNGKKKYTIEEIDELYKKINM